MKIKVVADHYALHPYDFNNEKFLDLSRKILFKPSARYTVLTLFCANYQEVYLQNLSVIKRRNYYEKHYKFYDTTRVLRKRLCLSKLRPFLVSKAYSCVCMCVPCGVHTLLTFLMFGLAADGSSEGWD